MNSIASFYLKQCSTALFLILLVIPVQIAWSQTTISGQIVDASNNRSIPGANVVVENTVIGTATNVDGTFTLTYQMSPPFNIVVSSIGYQTRLIAIDSATDDLVVSLEEATLMVDEVVVSASRIEEDILKSPVTIEKMDLLEIRNTAASNMWDGLKNIREVEVIANSMFFKSVRSRGYGTAANYAFKQYVDGVDNAPVANGQFALGNLSGISDIDVESIEILPGAASALYGPSAFSGIMFINSKNPFYHQGLSVSVGSGVNNESYAGTTPFYNVAVRYGKALSPRVAFKVVGDYIKATDWHAYSFEDKGNLEGENHAGNPDYDGINIYGDDYSTDLVGVRQSLVGLGVLPDASLAIPLGTQTIVTRTGYREEDLFDYGDSYNLKFNAGLYFRLTDTIELSTRWRYGTGKAIYQGTNRYALDGLNSNYYVADLKGDNFLVRGFYTREDAGDSYDIVFAGWNVNREWSDDNTWFGEYTGAYVQTLSTIFGTTGTLTETDYNTAHSQARSFADRNRLDPSTEAFQEKLREIQLRKDFRTGAGFRSESSFVNFEGQYDFSEALDEIVEFQVGGNFRRYDVNTFGTIYSDAEGDGFNVDEWGVFGQLGKSLLDGNLKLQGSLRADGHTNFDTEISPRISTVFTVGEKHNFRAAYQSAILNPNIEAQYINLNLGPIILIGGSPDNAERTGTEGFFDGTDAVPAEQVAALQAGQITPADISPVQVGYRNPSKLREFSVGYKSLLTQNLFIDTNFWWQRHSDFFTQQVVFSLGELQQSLVDPSVTPTAYSVYTSNTDNETTLQGIGLTLTYDFDSGYRLSGNWTYQDLIDANFDDFVNDTNTPKNKFSLSIGHREVTDNLGFRVSMRYRDGYFYYSTFGDGDLPAVTVFDAQLTYNIPTMGSRIKAGVNNIGQNEYLDAWGSVRIGTTYYITYVVDQLFK